MILILKHSNILKRYLYSVNQQYPYLLKIEYFKIPNSRNFNYPMNINKENYLNFMKF